MVLENTNCKHSKRKLKTIFPTRAQLINKGIIYPVRHSELDFTVPEFNGFIQRLDEYKRWCEENEYQTEK